jgi:hypothetical protein
MSELTRILSLRLKRISIVDDGDNPDANILLIKRRDKNIKDKDLPNMSKDTDLQLTDEQRAEIVAEAVAKAKADAKADAEDALKKAKKEAEDKAAAELKEARDALAKLEGKNVDADEMAKRVAKAEKDAQETRETLAKLMDVQAEADAVAKVKQWDNIPNVTDDTAALVMAVRKSAPGKAQELEALLDGANQLIGESELLKVKGSDGDASGDAMAKIQAKANELRKADPTLNDADAMVKAMDDNPDLMKQYEREYASRPTKNPDYEGSN